MSYDFMPERKGALITGRIFEPDDDPIPFLEVNLIMDNISMKDTTDGNGGFEFVVPERDHPVEFVIKTRSLSHLPVLKRYRATKLRGVIDLGIIRTNIAPILQKK